MKFTRSWLEDHLDTEAALDEIVAKLTLIGLEVEAVENPAEALRSFTIARVLEVEPHPDADKLKLCTVDTGEGCVRVVCGAPNACKSLIGVFAPEGTWIPGSGKRLTKAVIRGVESSGMLCSERELELSDEHTGIIALAPEFARHVGESFAKVMGLDDPVIEIGITPNRPDCLGVRGIARDLAAAGLGRLKPGGRAGGKTFALKGKTAKGAFDCPVPIALDFPKTKRSACPIFACPVFAGRVVRGITNGPAPEWMQRRLRAIGLRPINALVDVTNYIACDLGRPLHVYDADKLKGTPKGTIRARMGKKGETFLALDGETYEVDGEMVVIADESGPLGLGGVIGGESTGCTQETRTVFIESAWFDPVRIAMTGRRTGIQSDARFRFERGVDPASVLPGLDLATAMILAFCGGSPSRVEIVGAVPEPDKTIHFNLGEVERLTGLHLGAGEIKGTLKTLGFGMKGKGQAFDVAVPTWRPDVYGPADLVEEVIRIIGIDRVPATPMPRASGVARPVLTEAQKRVARARRAAAGRGLVEAVTWSFVSETQACLFGGGDTALALANPISVALSHMRPGLLPGLIAAVGRNRDRGFNDPALFEIGQAYRGVEPQDQLMAAAGMRAGTARLAGSGRHWDGAAPPVDLFDAKADALAILAALGLDAAKIQVTRDAPDWYHPGRSGVLRLGPKITLAHFGELHPGVLETLDVAPPAVAFEVFLDNLPSARRKAMRARSALDASDLHPVRRDFAFLLDRNTPAGDVIRAARRTDKTLISDVRVFDLFEGEALGPGRKSLAIEVTIQPREKTLTDAEIDAIAARIIRAVEKATGGEIRT